MLKIDIRKPDGTVVNADLMSYFEIININKKYVFYTLDEIVENNLVKMYVAEVIDATNGITIGGTITEDEWANLKSIMKSILTSGTDPNIKYLKVGV